MTNTPFATVEDFRDIESLNYFAEAVGVLGQDPEVVLAGLRAQSRDTARTPMQWDASPQAGFTTGIPWIAVNPNHDRVNAEAEVADPDSVYHHYRRLIDLRHTDDVVAHGDFTMLLPNDRHVYAFTRRLDGVTLLVLGNFSGTDVAIDLPDIDEWATSPLLIGNYPPPGSAREHASLRPWETRVYRRDS